MAKSTLPTEYDRYLLNHDTLRIIYRRVLLVTRQPILHTSEQDRSRIDSTRGAAIFANNASALP